MNSIKKTNDGSNTIFVPALNEHYHSIHGAVNESLHVFIASGLQFLELPKLKILEIGFGTGLNAFLTAKKANENQQFVEYHSLEKYPVDISLIEQLDYATGEEDQSLFMKIHECKWNQFNEINPFFKLNKARADLKNIELEPDYDLIYFDAFAPEKQPGMWTDAVFKKIYDALNVNGVLVTYCAKGVIRRRMQSIGFEVNRIPGPPGKREMLRAIKK